MGSIRRFYPQFDTLVIDDGSGPRVSAYLAGLSKSGELAYAENQYKYRPSQDRTSAEGLLRCFGTGDRSQETLVRAGHQAMETCDVAATMDTRHGMLYPHIRVALHYASAMGYDYLWLVQSDMQMVFGCDGLLEQVDRIAEARPTMIGVCPVMVHRCNPPDLVWDGALGVYRGARAFVATGLYRLDPIRRQPDMIDQVQRYERQSSYSWHARGFEVGYLRSPGVAHVPWPMSGGIADTTDAQGDPPLLQPAVDPAAWAGRDPAVPPFADYAVKTTYPTRLPGPPYWYNEAYLERFMELCLGQRQDQPPARTVPRVPERPNADRMPHYWQPSADAAVPAAAPPRRIRGWLKRHVPPLRLLKGWLDRFRCRRRIAPSLPAYRRFHEQVCAERDWLWGDHAYHAVDGDKV